MPLKGREEEKDCDAKGELIRNVRPSSDGMNLKSHSVENVNKISSSDGHTPLDLGVKLSGKEMSVADI